MWGQLIAWTGLTILIALPKVFPFPNEELVGAILMIVGTAIWIWETKK